MVAGAAAAALVELDPAPQEERAALFTSLAQAGGSGSGPVIAGMLAEWAPHRLVLPFALFAAFGVAAAISALAIPNRPNIKRDSPSLGRRRGGEARRRRERWDLTGQASFRLVKPSVPAEIRTLFLRASLTGAAVWAVASTFLSVVPSYAGDLLDTENLALLGAVSGTMLATSCAAQIAVRERPPAHARDQAVGPAAARGGPGRAGARVPGEQPARC